MCGREIEGRALWRHRSENDDIRTTKDEEVTSTEEAHRAAAVWEAYWFAESEHDRVAAADRLIEYMESMGLDDLSNWVSFAENWSHPHKNLFFAGIAEAAAECFDLPFEQLDAAADHVAASQKGKASFGEATTRDYRKTFFDAHPETQGRVVVHHAVEQSVLNKFPGVVNPSEIHSLENLRGIPKGSVNNEVHLSAIRREWNRFYKPFLRDGTQPTKQELLDFATYIDDKYGDQFNPPIR